MKKWFTFLALPVILAPVAYLWKKWPTIPDTVPVHYGLNGEADRMGSKSELLTMVLVLAGVSLLVLLILPRIYKIDPKKSAAENKGRLSGIAFATMLLMSVITFIIVDNAGEAKINFESKWLVAALGAFWAVMGNYMYNIKPNWFAGIRLPWTLASEDNWRLTHRLAGKLWFAGGLLILILAFLLPTNLVLIAFMVIAALSVIIPSVYSYIMFARSKKNSAA